jgi:hypothetical protein
MPKKLEGGMDMSAPGIQLSSAPQLTYFQPTIQEYLQGIKEAVMSNNLPAAQQAFAQLTKAVPSPSQGSSGQANELATRTSQSLQAVGNALEAGDLAAAGLAAAELRQNISSAQAAQQQSVAAESVSLSSSDASSSDDSSAEPGPNLSLRV